MDKKQLIDDVYDVLMCNDEMCTREAFNEAYNDLHFDVESNKERIRITDRDRDFFLCLTEQPGSRIERPKYAFDNEKDIIQYVVSSLISKKADARFIKRLTEYFTNKPTQLTLGLGL